MRTFKRTASLLAIVGTVGMTLSGCGWFRGEEDMAATSEGTTMTSPPTTTAQTAPTTAQMEPVQPAPITEEQYQESLQK